MCYRDTSQMLNISSLIKTWNWGEITQIHANNLGFFVSPKNTAFASMLPSACVMTGKG